MPQVIIGQGTFSVSADEVAGRQSLIKEQSSSNKQNLVQLDVKDSSLRGILWMISKQSGRQIVFDNSMPQLGKLVSLRLKDIPVLEAVVKVLEGSGLEAVAPKEGGTIVVRQSKEGADSVEQKGKGQIVGRVVDSATGKGISRVTVSVVGVNLSAVSLDNGSFTITNVPIGSQIISAKVIGYRTGNTPAEIQRGERLSIDLLLTPTATSLSEVVTTATGQQRRLEIGNDIVKINTDEIMSRAPIRSVTDMLQHAQVPGVQVTPSSGEPGAPARIRMRGLNSITGNNDPAVIVDGVWITAPTSTEDIRNKAIGNKLVSSRLDDIDPSSIETIEIIRGPSAATLYGQEAANGVIVITTKKGKVGTTRWAITFNRDWNSLPGEKSPLWSGFGTQVLSDVVTRCDITRYLSGACTQDSISNLNSESLLTSNEGVGYTNRYTTALSGGIGQITYFVNGAFSEELSASKTPDFESIRFRLLDVPMGREFKRPSKLEKKSLSLALSFRAVENLNLSFSLNAHQDNNRQNDARTNFISSDIRDTLGFLDLTQGAVHKRLAGSHTSGALLNIQAAWKPREWWHGEMQGGLQRFLRRDESHEIPRECFFGVCVLTDESSKRAYSSEGNDYTFRIRSSVFPSLRSTDRFISVVPSFGLDVRRSSASSINFYAYGMPPGSSAASSAQQVAGDTEKKNTATAGWYINNRINVLQRFYFDLGFRQDAGSAIKVSNAGRFPKLSTSWIISEEPFFPISNLLSVLRLRFALGHAAVHPEVADIAGRFSVGESFVDGRWIQSFNLFSIGNARLVPERSIEFETGMDMDLIYDRLAFSVTFASKNTKNAIVERRLPPSAGITNRQRKENVARVVNRSLEISATARVIDNSLMLWVINLSTNGLDNYVAEVGNAVTVVPVDNFRIDKGYPINGIWKRPVLAFGDINSDGYLQENEIIIGDTAIYIGWNTPRFSASYGSSFSLFDRRLTLSTQLSYRGGFIQSLSNYDQLGVESVEATLDEQALALLMRRSDGGVQNTINELRLNSASIALVLPEKVSRKLRARSVQVTFQGSNLGLWTSYRGRDPSVNSLPIGDMLEDNGSVMPPLRKYSFGFKLDF